MKFSKLSGGGGVSWKRYSKGISALSSKTVSLTFPEVSDWGKCAICISGVGLVADQPPRLETYSIDENTNTISFKIAYVDVTCDVYQFEGNVKIQRGFIDKYQPTGYTKDVYTITLSNSVNAEKCMLLYAPLINVYKTNNYSTYSNFGKMELSNSELKISTSHLDSQINLKIAYNIVELLD